MLPSAMGRALFQPPLEDLSDDPADWLAFLTAANSYGSDQRPRQIDRKNDFGLWHRSQLEMTLSLRQISISLAA
jgi:hypothetical protein